MQRMHPCGPWFSDCNHKEPPPPSPNCEMFWIRLYGALPCPPPLLLFPLPFTKKERKVHRYGANEYKVQSWHHKQGWNKTSYRKVKTSRELAKTKKLGSTRLWHVASIIHQTQTVQVILFLGHHGGSKRSSLSQHNSSLCNLLTKITTGTEIDAIIIWITFFLHAASLDISACSTL